ncbi:variant surface glycoprotein (VSG, atypical), putative [Trypanosoma brucei brucei TREU927]|uniref:Variant surface glycoprotein (VSG, atypical), putative n=1 Tax=Trypanosoma brucei brucei (strain 927/4 GUTat10.1) TaxID=185431 RepID=Q57XG6_TRYB2|nr:variant surface glycoprotein (VSG, atypical), putative [Trypanosoma brucei brucei TREU927]AAX69703.1 variant surface glycoprotein (VSG, atypical), putative [Trypanosoma brucei]AAZ11580.1 variant surface glycoprotein (VSG, atypical), putative [Trypanosoma brucei brucei TREU927]
MAMPGYAATASVILMMVPQSSDADTATAAHASVYKALCSVLQLQAGKIKAPDQEQEWQNAMETINDVNMTLGGPAWVNQFLKPDGTQKQWDPQTSPAKENSHWASSWAEWAASAERVFKKHGADSRPSNFSKLSITDQQLKLARTRMSLILEQASTLQTKIKSLQAAIDNAEPAKIKKLLTEAAIGTGEAAKEFTDAGKTSAARASAAFCGAGTVTGTDDCLADILICVCTQGNSDIPTGANKICSDHASNHAPKAHNLAAENDIKNQYDALVKDCNFNTEEEITPDKMLTALRSLESHIKIFKTDAYFGTTDGAATCDGTRTNGVCFKMPKYKTGKKGMQELAWATKIETAAAAMRAGATAASTSNALAASLTLLSKAAEGLASESKLFAAATTGQSSGNQPATDHLRATKEAERVCKTANDNQKECENLKDKGCVFNPKGGEGKKCTLSEEAKKKVEKENQEKWWNDGKRESNRYTRHTKKKDCEKENEGHKPGEKANCGRIEDKCNDSSFFVNKKMALSMAAAVMSLVAF